MKAKKAKKVTLPEVTEMPAPEGPTPPRRGRPRGSRDVLKRAAMGSGRHPRDIRMQAQGYIPLREVAQMLGKDVWWVRRLINRPGGGAHLIRRDGWFAYYPLEAARQLKADVAHALKRT